LQSLNRGPIGRDDFRRVGAAALAGLREPVGVGDQLCDEGRDALDRAVRMCVMGFDSDRNERATRRW
jgi:hypothetical protein